MTATQPIHRILVIDDNEAIHRDFAKILSDETGDGELAAATAALFGDTAPTAAAPRYELDFASQGEQALELLRRAKQAQRPYSLAFVDMRMPPGWDGLRTIRELWRELDTLHTVICTAYSDHALAEVSSQLGNPDRLLILKKPFDAIEVQQLAASLCEKSRLTTELRRQVAELERARADAEAANQAKSWFLAHMSHEVRTPLTAILGYAEILRREELPPDQRRACLDTICHSGEHLLRVVSDVLDMAKIEAGRLEFEQVPFSPATMIRQTVAIMHGAAAEKGLELAVEFRGEWPEQVLGDPTRTRQILINLVANAVKFTSTGSVRIRGGCRRDGDTADLSIAIEDTGIGIPAAKLPGMFSLFVQADASMTRRFSGTGLGLAIAQRLARGMDGEVAVQSIEGRGSTFTVTLQLRVPPGATWSDGATAPDQAEDVAVAESPAAGAVPTKLAGRILVVDDAVDNRKLVSHILRQAGAEVELANDGHDGLEAWRRARQAGSPFDLVVTDLQMPILDGLGLTSDLRRSGCQAPIVALTANAQPDERAHALQAGCDDYLTKPIRRQALLDACAHLLAKKPRAR